MDDPTQVIEKVNKELVEIASRSNPSVLRQRYYDGISESCWMSEVLSELASILSGLLENTIYLKKKTPAICLIYGIIMFMRCHELSRIQRINSVLVVQGQESINVSINFLNV